MTKTVLQEGSSLGSAIEKAWSVAGKPEKFSIRVLSIGEHNFFGFSTRPYVVSCVFVEGAEHSPAKENVDRVHDRRDARKERDKNTKPLTKEGRSNDRRAERKDFEKSDFDAPKKSEARADVKKDVVRVQSQEAFPSAAWTPQDAEIVVKMAQDVVDSLGKQASVSFAVEDASLNVKLSADLTDEPATEKTFYASLSTLMMQGLRKQTRKNFRGLRILISRD